MRKLPKVILLLDTTRQTTHQLLRGIAKYSLLHGPWSFYRDSLPYIDPAGKEMTFSRLKNINANGIITRDTIDIGMILKLGLPTIISRTFRDIPDVPRIIADRVLPGKLAAEHLLDRGFKHFAFCGFGNMTWSQERYESFTKRVAQAGFKTHVYKQPKSQSKHLWKNEQNVVAQWLDSLPKPVGLMTCNDDRGQQVLEACKIADIHVPEQIAVIGVDNDELICDLSDPPLSSVALNAEKAGYEAAELLDRLMAGEKMAGQEIVDHPTHVVTRQSTDILAIEDPEITKAIRHIRQHSREIIQVSDVAEAVGLSRRCLEKRFRKILHRTIHDEIRHVRIDQITRMLIETNLPVSKIAMILGYPSDNNLARYFRQETGMSLLAYRKNYVS